MKKLLIIASCASLMFASEVTKSFKVDGMHCAFGCANKVKSIVSLIDGIKFCEVDFEKSLMTVIYDGKKIKSDKIISSLNEQTTFKTTEILNKMEKEKFWSKFKKIFSKNS